MKNREALRAWSLNAAFAAVGGVCTASIAIAYGQWWMQAANAVLWLLCGVSIGGVLTMRDVIAGRFRR